MSGVTIVGSVVLSNAKLYAATPGDPKIDQAVFHELAVNDEQE